MTGEGSDRSYGGGLPKASSRVQDSRVPRTLDSVAGRDWATPHFPTHCLVVS